MRDDFDWAVGFAIMCGCLYASMALWLVYEVWG